MRVRVQVIIEDGEGGPAAARGHAVHDVAELERPAGAALRPEALGLTLAEAKAVLRGVQRVLVATQAAAYAAARRHCPDCGAALRRKGHHRTQVRTLFGTVPLIGPRLFRCRCAGPAARAAPTPASATFSPLAELLPEHVAPERLSLEAKWAALVSSGLTARLLADVLPLDDPVNATTVRHRLHRVAARAEAALGDERWSFIEGCPAAWARLPRPPASLTVGLDGGSVRGWADKRSHFEVIVGEAVPGEGEGAATCFGFVPGRGAKPRRRLFEVLRGHGLQANQQVTFLSDGGDTVRDLQFSLSPESEHVLDWFHVTMRLTVLGQYAKGLGRPPRLRGQPPPREEALTLLERTKHFLWHGNVLRALETLDDLDALAALLGDPECWDGADDTDDEDEADAAAGGGPPAARTVLPAGEAQAIAKLERGVAEFRGYIDANAGCIPNDGERHRQGEAIATGFVESTVNAVVSTRFAKRQQMPWTPQGAHLLLQVRTKVLNGELDDLFREWYPAFRPAPAETAAAVA